MRNGSTAIAPTPAVRKSGTVRHRLRRLDVKASPYLYVAPFFLIFIAFGLFPLGYTAWVSLTDRNLLDPATSFIGLQNYTALLHDSYFFSAPATSCATSESPCPSSIRPSARSLAR